MIGFAGLCLMTMKFFDPSRFLVRPSEISVADVLMTGQARIQCKRTILFAWLDYQPGTRTDNCTVAVADF